MLIDTLDAISPIDGRYRRKVDRLAPMFSERGLIERRTLVEARYLLALSDHSMVGHVRAFSPKERAIVDSLHLKARKNARLVKQYEEEGRQGKKRTNHDVTAIVEYIKELLSRTSLHDVVGSVHFALTSEDINNISYALQLRDALEQVIIPALNTVRIRLDGFAYTCSVMAMLARTHGQAASPTTLGKEFRVFAERLGEQLAKLKSQAIKVKLNGASGNWNAHMEAYPEINWPEFSRCFIASFNEGEHEISFEANLVTTQIEPHDTYAELFDRLKTINTILVDFCQDVWRYISDDWLVQKAVEGEHGSSAMPNKVNPIDHENAEGNLQIAIALCEMFARVLPVSRLQRHLSDSTIIRNFGVCMAHSLQAYDSIVKGINKIAPNRRQILKDLRRHPEVVTEAIQIVLRKEGVVDAYDKLRELTRGKKVTLKILRSFLSKLRIRKEAKQQLLSLTPERYTGLAGKIAQEGQFVHA